MLYFALQKETRSGFSPKSFGSVLLHGFLPLLKVLPNTWGTSSMGSSACEEMFVLQVLSPMRSEQVCPTLEQI